MGERVNIGLIGAGRIGRVHGRHLARRIDEANLVAIADIDVGAAERLAGELGVGAALDDPGGILEDASVEAVVICSSTDTHAELIEAAAKAGKQVFCEKPIDHDLARIDQVLAAVAAAGVKLQVGFNRRFDVSFARARELVAVGRIGVPHILRITSRDPEPPPMAYVKVSGGLFLDMTIHDFDMARFLIGSEVEEVFAVGGVMVDPEIGRAGDIDTALVTLRFENGAIGTIDNSRRAVYGYDQRAEVFGSGGAIVVSNRRPDEVAVSDGQAASTSLPLFFFVERYSDAYLAEMSAFVQSVLDDTQPLVTGRDAREPVVMARAAWLSCHENRPVLLREVDPGR